MKQLFYALALLFGSTAALAAPGDTTSIQPFATKTLNKGGFYGAYDTTVQFPSGSQSYRNIYMTLKLGKYTCPPTEQYCAAWDYTLQCLLMTPGGDTIELGRLITPYAQNANPSTPSAWTHRYTFDVTDYYPLLKNNATVRLFYYGYSGGFTADVKFDFIEGTPARNVTGIKTLWRGDYSYGKASDPIDNNVTAKSFTAPAGTVSSDLKVTITGHGMDAAQNCAEFCPKNYYLKSDGSLVHTQLIWRDDCGFNNVFPQGGTWVYDRANWCPGSQVGVLSHTIPGLVASATRAIDLDFDPYTSAPGGNGLNGDYMLTGTVISYGSFNKPTDAALLDVLVPNKHEDYTRLNGSCGAPKIKVHNYGQNAITSLKIRYGMDSATYTPSVYTWTGAIASLQTAEIELPIDNGVRNAFGANKRFIAQILEVNNSADTDPTNDTMRVAFDAVPRWVSNLAIQFRTNNNATDNKWELFNDAGVLLASRQGQAANTTYRDTLNLATGCYRLRVSDAGCDGLRWWANTTQGTGSFSVTTTASPFPLALSDYYSGDFGCGFEQQFVVGSRLAVEQVSGTSVQLGCFPNPATNQLTVALENASLQGQIEITDLMGKTVLDQKVTGASLQVNTQAWPSGFYLVKYTHQATGEKKIIKVSIVH
jgi:hypothetical protein